MACVPQTNTCKPDPCKTIVCPSDCWTCKVSADGIGTCVVDNEKCEPVNILVGQKGGGNAGCSCSTNGGGSGSYGSLGLLLTRCSRTSPRPAIPFGQCTINGVRTPPSHV